MRRENRRLGVMAQTLYLSKQRMWPVWGRLEQFYGHASSRFFSITSEFEKVRTLHTFASNCENKSQKPVPV
jgi:hypothetical protein